MMIADGINRVSKLCMALLFNCWVHVALVKQYTVICISYAKLNAYKWMLSHGVVADEPKSQIGRQL